MVSFQKDHIFGMAPSVSSKKITFLECAYDCCYSWLQFIPLFVFFLFAFLVRLFDSRHLGCTNAGPLCFFWLHALFSFSSLSPWAAITDSCCEEKIEAPCMPMDKRQKQYHNFVEYKIFKFSILLFFSCLVLLFLQGHLFTEKWKRNKSPS